VALGVGCRLWRFWLDFPIWRDEADLALNFVERDYRGLLCELSQRQVAPLLFLWIEKSVVLGAGASTACLRLLPLLAGIGGLILFWRLVRICLSPAAAVLAVGILAVSPWPIELACTIKPYALDLFLAVLLLLVGVHYLRQPRRTGLLAGLALLIPFAVGLSYPVVFVAGAVSLVLFPIVFRQGTRAAGLWLLAFNVLLVVSFLGHFLLVGREKDPSSPSDLPLSAFMRGFWRYGFPPDEPLGAVWWCLRIHVGKMFSQPVAFNGGGLIGLGLIGLGAHRLSCHRQHRLLLLCLLPFALHLVAAFLHRYPYGMHPRLEQHLLPGFCLLVGTGLAALIERLATTPAWQLRGLTGCVAGLVLVGLAGTVTDGCQPYHDDEAQRARDIVEHLQREMQRDDRIVVRHEKKCRGCLRWQLLPLADRIQEEGSSSDRPAGRIWFVDECVRRELESAPEPLLDPPEEGRDHFGGATAWRTSGHRRFLAYLPVEKPAGYRICCDVYLCEPVPGERRALCPPCEPRSPPAESSIVDVGRRLN
jgi:hypothetical protein